MKSNVLLVIFLIIWIGIGGYLFFIDQQIKKLKQKLSFQERKEISDS